MKRKLIGGTTSTSLLALRAGEALAPRIIRKPEVERLTGYSGVQIWRLERGGAFPRRVQLSPMAIGWFESEVLDWIQSRVRQGGKRPPVQYRGGPTKRKIGGPEPRVTPQQG